MRSTSPLSVLALALSLSGCASSGGVLEKSAAYRKEANYFLAYKTLEAARQQSPGEDAIEKAYWKARLEYLVDHGQELIFQEDMLGGLGELEAALALDPTHNGARFWIQRAKQKLAMIAVRKGDEQRVTGDLDAAFKLFTEAVSYVPGLPDGIEGLARVRAEFDKKQRKAADHYTQGVRSQAEQNYEQTRYHLGEALLNDPTLEGAKSRREAVALRMADRRMQEAKRMEKAGRYGAALKEYTAIAGEQPEMAGIQERITVMKREIDAEQKVREGERAVFAADWTKARKCLEEAYDASVGERKFISEMLILLKEREQDSKYVAAKDLELEHDYESAILGFQDIEKAWPGFKDVRARVSSLEAALEIAGKAKARGLAAEQAGDAKAAIEAYQEALLACPGYQGLDKRVRELKTKT